ncbi:MAG: phosphoglucosamine mutase [Candidatus Woesearchaeota archaeon]|jgi:phosphomannomutase
MQNKPKLTISGYRGIWGESLDEQLSFEFGLSYAKLIKNNASEKQKLNGLKVLIGQDARKTGVKIFRALASAFEKENIKIDYAGIIPTPSILLLVNRVDYAGGIIITASHNPIEYNGLKFLDNAGLFLGQDKIEEINFIKENLNDFEKNFIDNPNIEYIKKDFNNDDFREIHIREILKVVDVDLIKKNKFKVTLDPINSAGSIITQELLKELGCEINVINGEQTGIFSHEAEPLIKNLTQLSDAVKKSNSMIGFAEDPDADRLVIVDEKGEIQSEEYTLALAMKNVFYKTPSDTVVNMSSSRICEDIANSFGKKLYRSKIGELNVVHKMMEVKAIIGGEGNGGVIYPKVNMARDSMVGIALILELMARENKTISLIINELPHYLVKKEKIVFNGDMNTLYEDLKKEFNNANSVDILDGIRFDWNDYSWIHIRRSNTEPKMWIISEAKTKERIDELFERAKLIINNIK